MLNNPFCYTPAPSIVEAARALSAHIDATPELKALFSEGKMLGVLEVAVPDAGERAISQGAFRTLVASGAPATRNTECSTRPTLSPSPSITDTDITEASAQAAGGFRSREHFSRAGRKPEPPSERSSMFLFAFSGLAGGKAYIEGFVPPIFDWKPEDIQSSSPEESRRLQDWLFDQYVVVNGRGERRSIRQIFADRGLVPPGGTGDCAAPKLLQYALTHGLRPLAIGEFWYGASPAREIRRSGAFYPACTGKCGPLLGYMLQGVEVEPNPLESDAHWKLSDPLVRYEDDTLIVAEKPAGMLAVPGRPVEGVPPRKSLQDWLGEYTGRPVLACHRLDMDTSGLMVFAKSRKAQAILQQQFEHREVSKAYLAWVMADGKPLKIGDKGKISLPISPDWYDRPRQKVDPEQGKPAVTDYEVLDIRADGAAFVRLIPYTGRTHQLRVHCAHPAGLGRPILGDRLYGGAQADRLLLHAAYLSFRHPADSRRMTFQSDFSPVLKKATRPSSVSLL